MSRLVRLAPPDYVWPIWQRIVLFFSLLLFVALIAFNIWLIRSKHMAKPKASVLRGKTVSLAEAANHHVSRLGAKCICCGETTREFLEVDWIEDDPGGGFTVPCSFYAYLDRERDAPVAVYCANCHHARKYYGTCPHETARRAQPSPSPDDTAGFKPSQVMTEAQWLHIIQTIDADGD
jgi:hypothetical protein